MRRGPDILRRVALDRLSRLRFLKRDLLERARFEREMKEELATAIDLATEERIRAGADPAEARRAARCELGRVEQSRELLRAERVGGEVERVWLDLRYALRRMRRQPGFTVVVVATLALGIGASTAIFSVVRSVLLAPLPFAENARMVRVRTFSADGQGGRREGSLSPAFFAAVRERSRLIESIAAQRFANVTILGDGGPTRVAGTRVSVGWQETLGVRPIAGRIFTREEESAGDGARVVVIGHGLWQRRFGGDGAAIGSTLTLDQRTYSIIGVMPREFAYPYGSELWIPATTDATAAQPFDLNAPARFRAGTTLAEVDRELEALGLALSRELGLGREIGMFAVPMSEEFGRDPKRTIALLAAAVGCVLLLACVNLATLLLARGESRRRELALRNALGSSRARQLRLLLTESLLLALFGGGLGIGFAWTANRWLRLLIPPRLGEVVGAVHLDLGVLALTLLVCVATGLLFGLLPALRLTAARPASALRLAGRSSAGTRHQMLDALVVAEVALALILLVGATLTGWNLSRLLAVDVGYEPANLVRLQLGLSDERYADAERRAITVREIVARVASTPGVVAAGATMLHPIPGTRSNVGTAIGLEGEIDPTAPPAVVNRRLATPGYLEAIGLPLERGRTIEARDDARAQPVVVISRATARRFWPGRDPVGERLRVGSAEDPEARWHTVIGVVGDLLEPYAEMGETVYQPYAQATASLPAGSWITTSVALLVRTEGRLPELVARVRTAAGEIDPELPLYDVSTVESLLAEPLSDQRLGATLFAAFGAFGLLLAALGIYGMVSYAVTRRLPEFGLRLALGAVPTDLKHSVLLATAWRVGLGLLVGAGIALLVGPALGDALSEIDGRDPLVVAASAAVLLAAGLLAAWAPARRAMRADPASSLRAE